MTYLHELRQSQYEEREILALSDLNQDLQEELREAALIGASNDDLIIALADKGLPEYAQKFIKACLARIEK